MIWFKMLSIIVALLVIFRFRDIFDDYVIGMKEAVEAEEGAKDK